MGDAFGQDRFKYGSEDYRAAQRRDEWNYDSGTYRGGRGMSVGKLLLFGANAVVALIGYFGTPREATAPPPTATTSSTTRLDVNDQRVVAASDDVRSVVQLPGFTSNGGELLVFEGQLATPERNLTQTRFNVGDLDLYRATYADASNTLNVPCKQNAVCVADNVYEGATAQTAGASRQYGTYTSMNLVVPSNDAANRILQDYQQLQNLQQ